MKIKLVDYISDFVCYVRIRNPISYTPGLVPTIPQIHFFGLIKTNHHIEIGWTYVWYTLVDLHSKSGSAEEIFFLQ